MSLGPCTINGEVLHEPPAIALNRFKADGSGCPIGVSGQAYEKFLLECIQRGNGDASGNRSGGTPKSTGLNQANGKPADLIVAAGNDIQATETKGYTDSPQIKNLGATAVASGDSGNNFSHVGPPSNGALITDAFVFTQGNIGNKAGPTNANDRANVDANGALNISGGRTGNLPASSDGAPPSDKISDIGNQKAPSAQAGDSAQTGGAIDQAKTPNNGASISDDARAGASYNGATSRTGGLPGANKQVSAVASAAGATGKTDEAKDQTTVVASIDEAAKQTNRPNGASDQSNIVLSVDGTAVSESRLGGKDADRFIELTSIDLAKPVDVDLARVERIAGGEQVKPGMNCGCKEGN
ncbi:hypothetical protein BD779DRAFT_1506446 [Infundibulicybe gibba]|nr:hypothetical protein BD779DRAFT_1506446 [Infundibulicybe gibba]